MLSHAARTSQSERVFREHVFHIAGLPGRPGAFTASREPAGCSPAGLSLDTPGGGVDPEGIRDFTSTPLHTVPDFLHVRPYLQS